MVQIKGKNIGSTDLIIRNNRTRKLLGAYNVVVDPVQYKLGDTDSDGEVTGFDASLILQYEVGLIDETGLNLSVGDVDGDGEVTGFDASLILQYEVGLIERFPAE